MRLSGPREGRGLGIGSDKRCGRDYGTEDMCVNVNVVVGHKGPWHGVVGAGPQNGFTKKHPFFLHFGTRGTIRIFCCFAPAVLCALIRTEKKRVEHSMFAIRFLCFFLMFSMRVFGVSGHLPMFSENGVAQILQMCSVVFGQHAVIPLEGSLPPETNAVGFFVLAIN